jgi:hypothetical protein
MKRLCTAAVLMWMTANPLWADKITLTDGRVYEGKLIKEGVDDVTLEVIIMGKTVQMTVPRKDIESHEKTVSVKEQYEARLDKVNKKDADALVDLASWCKDNGLMNEAVKHLTDATTVNPEHKVALRILQALGYVQVNGKWLTEAEYKRSLGLERWGDKWLPKSEVERLQANADADAKQNEDEAKKNLQIASVNRGIGRIVDDLKSINTEYAQLVQDGNGYAARLENANARISALQQQAAPYIDQAQALNAEAARVEAWTIAMTNDTIRARNASAPYRTQASYAEKSARALLNDAFKIKGEAAGYEQKLRFTMARMRVLEQEYEKKKTEALKLKEKKDALQQ